MSGDVLSDDPSEYLPHRAPMVLIDRIVAITTEHIESEVTIREDSQFYRGSAVSAWVGVEYLAQTCAAFAGYEARSRGEAVRAGFLIAARNYRTHTPAFELGTRLRVRLTLVHREHGGLSVVEGQIHGFGSAPEASHERVSESPLVEATLTVYEVPDLAEYMRLERAQRSQEKGGGHRE